jgi:hypothetical protein
MCIILRLPFTHISNLKKIFSVFLSVIQICGQMYGWMEGKPKVDGVRVRI